MVERRDGKYHSGCGDSLTRLRRRKGHDSVQTLRGSFGLQLWDILVERDGGRKRWNVRKESETLMMHACMHCETVS